MFRELAVQGHGCHELRVRALADHAAVVESLADPMVRNRFADLGQEIPARKEQTPEALYAHQKAEIAIWHPIIRAAGLKAE